MDSTLHLTIRFGTSAKRFWVVLSIHFDYIAVCILFTASTLNDVSTLQTNFLTRSHTEELLWSIFHKVFTLHPKFTTKGDRMRAFCLVFGIVDSDHLFFLTLRIVGDDEFYGVEHSTQAQGSRIEIFAGGSFKHCKVVERVKLRIADHIDKLTHSLRRIATPAKSANGGHTRIIPTIDDVFLH